jgi:membrane protein YqaA with SNARE-associated domain
MAYKILIVFLLGLTGIWKAVPAGFLLKIPVILVFSVTVSGATAGVVLVYLFENWIIDSVVKNRKRKGLIKKQSTAKRLFEKYGIAGLALLGTISIGSLITILMGLIFADDRKKLLMWTLVSIVLWSAVLTVVALFSSRLLLNLLKYRKFHFF